MWIRKLCVVMVSAITQLRPWLPQIEVSDIGCEYLHQRSYDNSSRMINQYQNRAGMLYLAERP